MTATIFSCTGADFCHSICPESAQKVRAEIQ